MSIALTINAKSPVVKYNDLILARFINESSPNKIQITVIDDKANKIQSQLELNGNVVSNNDVYPQLVEILNDGKLDSSLYELCNSKLTLKKFDVLNSELEKINNHFDLRTYYDDGSSFSVNDICLWGILRSNGLMGSILKNKLKDAAEGKKKEGHKANFDIDLPGAKIGEVVTRFPPEPSGYLHIGHAKAALLNQYFANQFKGKLLIRFDDTNPSKEKEEYEQSIIEDLALMEIKGDSLSYTSDHFDLIYDYALKMIKEGKAYCDDTDVDTMREERGEGIKSRRRDRSVEENLKIFTEEMKNATEEGLKNCLRAKIDYQALNKTLRDPVIYRCNLTPHHRTGTTLENVPNL
ncbi:unnamed protein product [Hanseniaspora opuntiae]